jgi:hypothetical protein
MKLNWKWIDGTFNGFYFEAKVYDAPSEDNGLGGGRISKLEICEGPKWNADRLVYRFDRGLDIDKINPEILKGILTHLESPDGKADFIDEPDEIGWIDDSEVCSECGALIESGHYLICSQSES